MQLDQAERGFSFLRDGPLDMRMNVSQTFSAQDIVNNWSEDELANLIHNYGEDRHSKAIARTITARRKIKPFTTTLDLSRTIEEMFAGRGITHPATRTFQAIRMQVNDELGVLQRALKAAISRVRVGGRIAVLTFHSLEDGVVKRLFREESFQVENPLLTPLSKKPIESSFAESKKNRRARSAKLRCVEKMREVR